MGNTGLVFGKKIIGPVLKKVMNVVKYHPKQVLCDRGLPPVLYPKFRGDREGVCFLEYPCDVGYMVVYLNAIIDMLRGDNP